MGALHDSDGDVNESYGSSRDYVERWYIVENNLKAV